MGKPFSQHDVVIICGGFGTRLQPVIGERQKVVAEIGGKPFLGILIDHLADKGFCRFVLAAGFKKEEIEEYLARAYGNRKDLSFVFSNEDEPLGTGGALKRAMAQVASNHFLVVNGDTFCDLDMDDFYATHKDTGSRLTIALIKSERHDGGNVVVGDSGRIVSFLEKQKKTPSAHVNAGMYWMHKIITGLMPREEKFSLETDLFPRAASAGVCYGYQGTRRMLDIGTPERFESAPEFLKSHIT